MKQFYILTAMLFFSINIWAQTQVSGNQSGTWTLANTPYEVTGDITIPSGQTLTIEAGVTINFQGHYRIYVNGKMEANGTDNAIITFTPNNINTGWAGIRLDGTTQISTFHYCRFEYGKTSATGGYPDMHGGAVVIKDADAQFYNCTFYHNDATGDNDGMGGAVYTFNSGSSTQSLTKFIDCTFEGNHAYGEGGAIKFTNDGNSEITRCKFISNSTRYGGGAILIYTGVGIHITNCLFYNNVSDYSGGGAIKTLNPQSTVYFTNNTFAYNSANGNAEGGAVNLNYADALFTNCIFYGNTQQYGESINIGMNASAQINNCDLVMPSDATGSNNLNNVNPQFVSATDFHLQAGSPCIDTGLDVGLPYNGTAPDMGCYEYGTSDIKENTINIAIFPNPVSDYLHFDFDRKIDLIEITDMTGKVLARYAHPEHSIHLSKLQKGMYFVNFYYNGQVTSKKIFKK